ncbi:MAG TPA: SRPBCC family protein, partial [Sphingomonas sp.]|nr:SRPBCC family protein [Sphingomonas sp.]
MARSRKPDSLSGDWSAAKVAFGAGAVAAVAGAAFLLNRKSGEEEPVISDSPPWTHKNRPAGEHGELTGRSQTINRPRQEVYDAWRDFTRFPEFMDNVRSVEKIDGDTSRWTIEAPAGQTVELNTKTTHDVPGERIAWKSTEESQIDTAGEVLFKDSAPGRGTIVTLVLTYAPPGGTIGKLAAKLFRREPAIQARLDLRRFKQLLETGEVTTN